MKAGSRSPVPTSHAAATRRADELRVSERANVQRKMEYFVVWRFPRLFPSHFLFLHAEALAAAAAAEGRNKPGKEN